MKISRRHLLSACALAALILSTWRGGDARADQLFVKVTGQVQGVISGWYNLTSTLDAVDLSQYGQVDDLAWSVISPRDAASGLPTGKRLHRPLTLRVRMSNATLLVGNALSNNENLTQVRVRWFARDPATGVHTAGRELILTNASVSIWNHYTVREQDELVTYVDFSMTYQRIGIEDPLTGISYEDDWESPTQ